LHGKQTEVATVVAMDFNFPGRILNGSADVCLFEAIQFLPLAPAKEFGETAA
jgi:hypothetical protein